jgi:hypothetical protein
MIASTEINGTEAIKAPSSELRFDISDIKTTKTVVTAILTR